MFIVVDGGNASGEFDNQVAEAIMKKKSAGCGMTAANENLSTHATVHRITISPEIGAVHLRLFTIHLLQFRFLFQCRFLWEIIRARIFRKI